MDSLRVAATVGLRLSSSRNALREQQNEGRF